jgi:hypothetical protein
MSTNNQTPGVVNIRGKSYQTVALRVSNFKTAFPSYSLVTEILHRDTDCVVMLARIADPEGRVIATGHAEEYRKASEINKTSALENAETSAIGRALAALGLGGTEFASADEVARAVSGAKGDPQDHTPMAAAMRSVEVSDERKAELENIAMYAIEQFKGGQEAKALELAVEIEDNDEKLYFWHLLRAESKLRAFIKANAK